MAEITSPARELSGKVWVYGDLRMSRAAVAISARSNLARAVCVRVPACLVLNQRREPSLLCIQSGD